MAANRDK